MKILLVTAGYPPEKVGGAGLYVHYLATELSKRHDVHVLITSKRGRKWMENGITYHAVPPVKSILRAVLIDKTYSNPEVENYLRRVLKGEDPDVVHFHNIWAFRSGFLPRIASELGYPTVQTLHDYWFVCPIGIMSFKKKVPCQGPEGKKCADCWNDVIASYLRNRGVPSLFVKPFLSVLNKPSSFERRLSTLREVINSVDVVISPSKFLRKVMIENGVKEERIVHLPNGYPHSVFSNFSKKSHDGIVFGFVGVPSYQKGAHIAVKAARLLEKRYGNFELRIYGGMGDQGYVKWLRSLIGPSENVKFMGRFEDIKHPYSEIDVLLFPSLCYENCPLVLAEAALTKTPVIGSNLGAIPEFVHHNENGFLFTPGDHIELAKWMENFIEKPELVGALGKNQIPVEDMKIHAQKVLRIYKKIV